MSSASLYEIYKSKSFKKAFLIYLLFFLPTMIIGESWQFMIVLSLVFILNLMYRFYQERHCYEQLQEANAFLTQYGGLYKRYGTIQYYANTLVFTDFKNQTETLIDPEVDAIDYDYKSILMPSSQNDLVNLRVNGHQITMKHSDYTAIDPFFQKIKPTKGDVFKKRCYEVSIFLLAIIILVALRALYLYYSHGTIDMNALKKYILPNSAFSWLLTFRIFKGQVQKSYVRLTRAYEASVNESDSFSR